MKREYVNILGTGSYLPELKISDDEIMKRWSVNRKIKVLQRLYPVTDRRKAGEKESCSDLVTKAALNVLESAREQGHNIFPKDLDLILVSGTPGDYHEPATASIVQYNLRAQCPAYDIKMSCVGWLAGMDVAMGYLGRGMENILVLGGTRIGEITGLRPEQRFIFGDGAGGVLIGRNRKDEESHVRKINLYTFGEYNDLISLSHEQTVGKRNKAGFHMGGKKRLEMALKENIGKLGVYWDDFDKDRVDWVFVHKPSDPIGKLTLECLGFPEQKIIQNFNKYGNTVSADLPIALDEAVKEDRVKRGDYLFFFTYGAGISAGAMLLKY